MSIAITVKVVDVSIYHFFKDMNVMDEKLYTICAYAMRRNEEKQND